VPASSPLSSLAFPETSAALLRIGAATSYAEFAEGVMRFLDQSIEFNVAEVRLRILDKDSDAAVHASRRGPAPAAGYTPEQVALRKRLAPAFHYMERNPGTQVYRGAHHTLPARRELERTQFYQEFMGPEGWHDYLGLGFWNDTGRDGWIFINRAAHQPLFTDAEVVLFQHLYPFFAGALQRINLLNDERALRASLEDSLLDLPIATLVLDWRLAVVQANRAAHRMCVSWHHGPERARVLKPALSPEVPVELLQACRELKDRWRPDRPVGEARRIVPHPARPGLQATVTLLRPNALRLGPPSFLVRITEVEHYAGDREARRAQLFARLSAAEREVVKHVMRGATNKDIAARLGKSLPTVKNQLHSVLEKTGAASRAELIAALSG